MIKFFRHIRRQLLGEGKTGKYLKYAIGEILLVMVGILLALQVNNWNEKRLEALQEKTTLSNLNTEFKENLKNLDSINKYLLKTISATETIFSMFTVSLKLDPQGDRPNIRSNTTNSTAWEVSNLGGLWLCIANMNK